LYDRFKINYRRSNDAILYVGKISNLLGVSATAEDKRRTQQKAKKNFIMGS